LSSTETKIFGVGWHRTGTKTLSKCLTTFGYNVQTWSPDVFDRWATGGPEALIPIIEEHDAFEDWPWPFCYEFLYRRYPDARFILTCRKNSDAWLRSYIAHSHRVADTHFQKLVYGYDFPEGAERTHIKIYEEHNQKVRKFFSRGLFSWRRKPTFLEVCWEKGDGWKSLAAFLDKPIPALPFPHENFTTPENENVPY
jgi:hypothetical protein